MNYLQELAIKIQMSINGYKTPKSVIDKITKCEQRQYREQNYTSNRKSIYANPPYDTNN